MAPFKTSTGNFLGVALGNKLQRSRAANIVASHCATFSLHSSSWRFSKRSAALSALYCFRLFSESPSMRRENSVHNQGAIPLKKHGNFQPEWTY